ncbi:MAG TPA: glycosyl hydrolase family 28-related protein [Anaeromyxobacter sp.]|nr:glycosyl hydrolase family 28-related protein [Anaeromyxobacter sp.]
MILTPTVVALALAAAPLARSAAQPAPVVPSPSRHGRAELPSAWFDVRAFGARGDGRTDDSGALQAALDAAREAGGGVVYLPAGTYVVAPPRAPGGGVSTSSLTIGSRTWLRGDGAATVLKVKDGAGSYRALFTSHPTPQTPAEDVTLSDLRVDQNCGASGGKVGPGGGDFIVWLAWGGRNLTVERVRFEPICGVNTVVLNAPTARNLAVRDSTFRFVKGPTGAPGGEYDNSAIYVHGRGMVVSGNLFEADVAAGARGAIELHGAAGVAANNVTRGYRACVRVVGTSEKGEAPPAGNGFSVTGNACLDANDAINVWGITGHGVRDVAITGNTITLAQLDHLAAQPAIEHASGISVVWDSASGVLSGDVRGLVVEGNTISAQASRDRARKGAYSSAGIALAPMGNLSDVVVRGNVLRDLPARGIWVEAKGRGARATRVRIEGNVVLDAGHDPSAGKHRAAIAVAGLLEDVEVAHNTVTASRTAAGGVDAVRVLAAGGSARVGVHDNGWSAPGGGEGYRLAVDGPVDAGPAGRTRAARVARGDGPLTLDASTARTWDLCFGAAGPFTIRGPTGAVPGQRLTIRIRNDSGARLGPLRWEGFRLAPFTPPAPRTSRVVEVEWDGGVWREVYQSAGDVPE